MVKCRFSLTSVLILASFAVPGRTPETPEGVDSLLRVVHDRDQAVREEVIRLSRQVPPQADSLLAACARMEETDAANQRIVAGLLDRNGWPEGISDESSETIWLVIDHADAAMQKRYMPLIEEQVRAGRVSASGYATLLDRILMREGLPQRYGTQTVSASRLVERDSAFVEQRCYLWPVESPGQLDSLRATVGLGPVGEYVKLVGETYGMPCIWDPALGVEELSALADRSGE